MRENKNMFTFIPVKVLIINSVKAEIPPVLITLKMSGTRGILDGNVDHPVAKLNLFTHLLRPDKLHSRTCQESYVQSKYKSLQFHRNVSPCQSTAGVLVQNVR